MRALLACALVLFALAGCDGGGVSGRHDGGGDARPPVDDVQRSCPDPSEAGCGMIRVEGSLEPFEMGHVGDPGDPNMVEGDVYVTGDLYVDTHEVTIARYRRFLAQNDVVIDDQTPVEVAGGAVLAASYIGFPRALPAQAPLAEAMGGTWTEAPAAREAHPVVGVDFYSALTFCYWDSRGRGRLPTEAEHEYLVRHREVAGMTPGRAFAWGDALVEGCDRAQVAGCDGEDGAPTRPVGSFAENGGLFDLIGNAEEWALDSWQPYYPPGCWADPVLEDPVCTSGDAGGPSASRGSSYESELYGGWRRARRARNEQLPSLGFRCARSIPRGP